MGSVESIDFVYDIVCPHAYLASQRVQAAGARLSMKVRFRPVLLGGMLRSIGAAVDPNAAMAPARVALLRKDLRHRAARAQPPLSVSIEHPRRTVEAMRLCVAASRQARPDITHALFRAHWEQGRDVSDLRVLGDIASAHGVDIAMLHAPATKMGLREATQWAVDRGAFGVPTFVVGSRLWWGEDRIELMVEALGGSAVLDRRGDDCGSSQRRAQRRRVEFFHDFASPFAYLASGAVDGVAARYGVTVRWRPILVGALFRTIGTADVPLLAMPAAKQAYLRQDLS
ncbi:MAG: DsbA family protein, partial [Nannocystaceae bacterium]|nr:DsbA family protein [Nannocystaceae bacterium]